MARRVNKAIELLASGQPVYTISSHGRFPVNRESGRNLAGTWADAITVEMEHGVFDMPGLAEFMAGLAEGGPTAGGHRTPAVIVELPLEGATEETVRANAWQIRQALARGVHGILLCHAERPEAARAFVESCRYPFHTAGRDLGLGDGRRGSAGQDTAAAVWGIEPADYLRRADPWPLNPEGELLLGLKIENRRALENAEATTATAGIAFAEWGPGDMGMSLGFVDQHDPPYPPEMAAARDRVRAACDAAGISFLNMVSEADVAAQIDGGLMIAAAHGDGEAAAGIGRAHTNRTMPV